MPGLPVVMPQAETASVADRSSVVLPSSTTGVELGVFKYHWPLAGGLAWRVGTNKGSFGVTVSIVANLVDVRELHRRVGAQLRERGIDVRAIEGLRQKQHVHARRELARLRHGQAHPARSARRRRSAFVCACATARPCLRATTVYDPYPADARKPTIRRCASGPMLTGGAADRVVLGEREAADCANGADPVRISPHASAARARAAIEPNFARQCMLGRSAGRRAPKSSVRLIRYHDHGLVDLRKCELGPQTTSVSRTRGYPGEASPDGDNRAARATPSG